MSFVKLDRQNFELTSILLKPTVHFVSSSKDPGGVVTGSQYVSSVRSKCIKQVIDLAAATNNLEEDIEDDVSSVSQYNIDSYTRAVALYTAQTKAATSGTTDLTGSLELYMSGVYVAPKDVRFEKTIDVFRFDPPFKYTNNTTVKNVVRNVLMPYNRHRYENCGFWYSNYNTLNFFDNDIVPSGSCLIYPNYTRSLDLPDTFSLNFWINPRYSRADRAYKAGTIFHMSSSIAVSLVSGSSINVYGEEDEFKLLLQLSHSADIPPSSIDLAAPNSAFPGDLVFTSSFVLKKNHWHHVAIMWGANTNNQSGSMWIDENETIFHVPSSSLSSSYQPDGLVIGNYYDGNADDLSALFGTHVEAEGVRVMGPDDSADPSIGPNMFAHPLNAEIHDIRLYNQFRDKAVTSYQNPGAVGPETTENLVLWIPPYFYPTTPTRSVLVTPFQTIDDSTTNDPFNVQFSFGVGGKMINLENFVRDFVTGEYPRLLELVPKTIDTTIEDITADQYVYEAGTNPIFSGVVIPTGSHIKRNMTILPCDNGLHSPRYTILSSSAMSASAMYQKSCNGVPDYSIINLDYLIPTASLFPGLIFATGSIFSDICGTAPDNPGVAPGSVLTIAQRTRDVSSNEIVVFDISNLYYGNKINPGSLEMYDEHLTGSQGDVKIKLRDNGRGSIYRADSVTKHATWNNLGNVLYEDGIVVLKTPHLLYFNKDKTNIKFKGEQNIHTMIVNVPCHEWNFTSSSNKTYKEITPTAGANDSTLKAVYLTGVNIHDNNFNVIMRASFSQPIVKTQEDEFVIRLKQDF